MDDLAAVVTPVELGIAQCGEATPGASGGELRGGMRAVGLVSLTWRGWHERLHVPGHVPVCPEKFF